MKYPFIFIIVLISYCCSCKKKSMTNINAATSINTPFKTYTDTYTGRYAVSYVWDEALNDTVTAPVYIVHYSPDSFCIYTNHIDAGYHPPFPAVFGSFHLNDSGTYWCATSLGAHNGRFNVKGDSLYYSALENGACLSGDIMTNFYGQKKK